MQSHGARTDSSRLNQHKFRRGNARGEKRQGDNQGATFLPSLFILGGFSLGVIIMLGVPGFVPVWWFFIVFLALLFLWCKGIFRKHCMLMLPVIVGMCWFTHTVHLVWQKSIPAEIEKQDVIATGQVVGVPLLTPHYSRFDLQLEQLIFNGEKIKFTGNIRVKDYQSNAQYEAGQHWRLVLRLKRARGFQNPGSVFDFEKYLYAHRIRATGYVRKDSDNQLIGERRALSVFGISKFRSDAARFIETTIVKTDIAAVVKALTIGLRHDMSNRQWRIYQDTGTTHLMAISGLHIGLVSGLVGLLFATLWRFVPAVPLVLPSRLAGVAAGVLAGFVYALLAGMTIPTLRAISMLSAVALLLWFRRNTRPVEVLLLVLAGVLMLDPLSTLKNGFWLSFGAVAALMLFAPATTSKVSAKTEFFVKLGRWFFTWSRAQWVLFICLAPILLFLFAKVSLVSPVANLVAVPLVGLVIVPCGLLSLLCWAMGLHDVAVVLCRFAASIIDYLQLGLEMLAQIRFSVFRQQQPQLLEVFIALPGIITLLCNRLLPVRWLGLVFLLPLVVASKSNISTGEFRYTMLEVGHGLASVIETRQHLLVYDTGPHISGGIDSGETVVLPFLQTLTQSQLDTLIVSHGDNDHIGGHKAVLKGIKTKRILTSVSDRIPGSSQCHRGQSWHWDGVFFEILWPERNSMFDGNDGSCVLRVSSTSGTLLLTGDIEKPAERNLITLSAGQLSSDVIQVPHQGSRTSSTPGLLNEVNAKIAIVSTGYLNRYKHPHKDVFNRYKDRRMHWFDTAYYGAISAFFKKSGIEIQGTRSLNRNVWIDHSARPPYDAGWESAELVRVTPSSPNQVAYDTYNLPIP